MCSFVVDWRIDFPKTDRSDKFIHLSLCSAAHDPVFAIAIWKYTGDHFLLRMPRLVEMFVGYWIEGAKRVFWHATVMRMQTVLGQNERPTLQCSHEQELGESYRLCQFQQASQNSRASGPNWIPLSCHGAAKAGATGCRVFICRKNRQFRFGWPMDTPPPQRYDGKIGYSRNGFKNLPLAVSFPESAPRGIPWAGVGLTCDNFSRLLRRSKGCRQLWPWLVFVTARFLMRKPFLSLFVLSCWCSRFIFNIS